MTSLRTTNKTPVPTVPGTNGTPDELVDEYAVPHQSGPLLSVAREPTIADLVFNRAPAIGSESFVKQYISSSACP